jgi:DNA-binding transcriptional LysR family regulator
VPVIREFHRTHPSTQVEVFGGLHADIERALLEGSSDLGLVNYLEGDDLPFGLETTPLLSAVRWPACGRTARWPRRRSSTELTIFNG